MTEITEQMPGKGGANTMENYEGLEVEVIEFDTEDVITDSSPIDDGGRD